MSVGAHKETCDWYLNKKLKKKEESFSGFSYILLRS